MALLQAAQPAGQAWQAVLTVVVQAAVWYCPAAQVPQALQNTPLPVNPGLQPHAKPPSLFEQVALIAQLAVPAVHSLMSLQPEAPPPV